MYYSRRVWASIGVAQRLGTPVKEPREVGKRRSNQGGSGEGRKGRVKWLYSLSVWPGNLVEICAGTANVATGRDRVKAS